MDSLEKRLKSIPVQKPSEQLQTRIFAQYEQEASSWNFLQQPIKLKWALSFGILMAIVGYSIAHVPQSIDEIDQSPMKTLEIVIVNQRTTSNTFDFSKPVGTHFLSGTINKSSEVLKEI